MVHCTGALELVPIISKVDDPNAEDKEALDMQHALVI